MAESENNTASVIRRCGEQCPIDRMLEGQPDELCLDPSSPMYLLGQCAIVGVEAAEDFVKTFKHATTEQIEEAVQERILEEVRIFATDESHLIVACVLKAHIPRPGCKLPNAAAPVSQPMPYRPEESGTPVPARHGLVKRWTHWPWA